MRSSIGLSASLAFLFSVTVFTMNGNAQSALQPVRNPQALTLVAQSLVAMGGVGPLAQVQNSFVSGTSVVSAANADQAAQQTATTNFTWTYAGTQFRLEDTAATGSHTLVSNGGSPQDYHDGGWFIVPPVTARTNLPYHIPALALYEEIQSPGYSFIYVGATTLNGKTVIEVQTRDDSDLTGHSFTPQNWYFDPATAFPLRVEYQIPISANATDSLEASMTFSNFQTVSGIAVPFQLNVTDGPVSFVSTVTSATFNASVDPSGFAPSSGGAQ
ncbi:MAG TPA: hypothetical protein VMJ93_10790 [Verrucomicrobiae bacterium]|nr:hypothetical protein [Verrucomicrobiae bacterium]